MRIIQATLAALVTATWLLLATPLLPAGEATRFPNIVLVMCDDLGWGDTGFNGNRIIQTPHLDAMARAGLKFNRFYAASAVCSPTRGSVVTGRHPYRYGIPGANRGHMKAQELTLAELLKQVGYATGHFGKWHLGTLTKTLAESNRGGPRGIPHYSPPWDNGFDVCFSTEAKVPTYDPMLKPRGNASGKGWDYITDKSTAVPYGTHYWNHQGRIVKDNLAGDDSRLIMDRVVPFIERAAGQRQPFLAIVWFHTPHLPVVAGPRYAKMYAQYDSYHKNYYGCISAMDEQIGRLRKILRSTGVADDTLVAFCSDNGPEGNRSAPGSAGPFRGRKRDLFEGGVRVPGIIEWPARIRPGRQTDYPAVTSDYLPTILEIIGVKMPDERPIDGISLVAVFDGQRVERPRPIGFQYGGKLALTDNRYKLVAYPSKGRKKRSSQADDKASRKGAQAQADPPSYMLFDLIEDPSETTDLAAQRPETVNSMARTLDAWRQSCQTSGEGRDYPPSPVGSRVFIGNTFADQLRLHGYIETLLAIR